jgi:hypothetical protein
MDLLAEKKRARLRIKPKTAMVASPRIIVIATRQSITMDSLLIVAGVCCVSVIQSKSVIATRYERKNNNEPKINPTRTKTPSQRFASLSTNAAHKLTERQRMTVIKSSTPVVAVGAEETFPHNTAEEKRKRARITSAMTNTRKRTANLRFMVLPSLSKPCVKG